MRLRKSRGTRHPCAGHDLRHHHRQIGPHALRAVAGSVLVFGPARKADHHRLQLRAGRGDLRAHIADIGRVADTLVCAYPNAGLPNEFGQYDETPEYMARLVGEFAQAGLVNVVGGCCGTTPAHIKAIAEACAPHKPRIVPKFRRCCACPGLEPFNLTADIPFVNVGERTNVTGSALPQADQERRLYRRAPGGARSGRERRAGHRRQHG
jgi:hypothetical protein